MVGQRQFSDWLGGLAFNCARIMPETNRQKNLGIASSEGWLKYGETYLSLFGEQKRTLWTATPHTTPRLSVKLQNALGYGGEQFEPARTKMMA